MMKAKGHKQKIIDLRYSLSYNKEKYTELVDKLCEQICKEQREICSKININHDYDSGLEVENAILNAPMPEL